MNSVSPIAPAQLKINLSALVENYHLVKNAGTAKAAPVLKANGYGLGAAKAFEALYKDGARQVFVATPEEAAELWALSQDVEIFVLGGFYHGADDFYMQGNFIPVLNSPGDIERWTALAEKSDRKLPAALHFDTGMNRLGLGADETQKLLADISVLNGIDLRLIISHFVASDEKDHPLNDRQAALFADIAKHFPHVPKSLCNSSGVFRNKNWHCDVLRPGICLYGGNPTPEVTNPMRRVVDLSVRILQTRCVKAGETAGYNATHIFQNDTTLATVALGYADGFHRTGSNKARLYYNGKPCPIVGRVSMDLVIVDTGTLKPQAGDVMEVLGPHQSIDDLARDLGTISYEIITSLGKRFERVYI